MSVGKQMEAARGGKQKKLTPGRTRPCKYQWRMKPSSAGLAMLSSSGDSLCRADRVPWRPGLAQCGSRRPRTGAGYRPGRSWAGPTSPALSGSRPQPWLHPRRVVAQIQCPALLHPQSTPISTKQGKRGQGRGEREGEGGSESGRERGDEWGEEVGEGGSGGGEAAYTAQKPYCGAPC